MIFKRPWLCSTIASSFSIVGNSVIPFALALRKGPSAWIPAILLPAFFFENFAAISKRFSSASNVGLKVVIAMLVTPWVASYLVIRINQGQHHYSDTVCTVNMAVTTGENILAGHVQPVSTSILFWIFATCHFWFPHHILLWKSHP